MITPTLPNINVGGKQQLSGFATIHDTTSLEDQHSSDKPKIAQIPEDSDTVKAADPLQIEETKEPQNDGGFSQLGVMLQNPQSVPPNGARPASTSNVQDEITAKAGGADGNPQGGMAMTRKKPQYINEKYVDIKINPDLQLTFNKDLISTKINVSYRKFKIPEVIEKPIDSYEAKPWLDNNRSNISDYFNYGKSCQILI